MSELYFAYGCNMDYERMASRCTSARVLGNASLKGFELTFPQPDEYWEGGVAGLAQNASGTVEGVIYEISSSDLVLLDKIEVTEDEEYMRESVSVRTKEGTKAVWTYFAKVMPGAPFLPSKRYLETMIRGAQANGLTQDYIKEIADWANMLS